MAIFKCPRTSRPLTATGFMHAEAICSSTRFCSRRLAQSGHFFRRYASRKSDVSNNFHSCKRSEATYAQVCPNRFPCLAEFSGQLIISSAVIFKQKRKDCPLCFVYRQNFTWFFRRFRIYRQTFRADMAKPVFQFIALAHQKIAEKFFKEFGGLLNSRLKVRVIRADKGIPKVPCIFGENIVIDSKAERAKIFDSKDRRRPRVSPRTHESAKSARQKRRCALRILPCSGFCS